MQELAEAIATRLIVTPNQAFSSFAIGSVAPTSNVGPWLKDCETWFVFDDTTGTYIPMRFPFQSSVVGIFTATNTLLVDTPILVSTWTDILSVVAPKQGGTVHVTSDFVLSFVSADGASSHAIRITDGTNHYPVSMRDVGTAVGNSRFPLSIDLYATLPAGVNTTYTLQASASGAGTSLILAGDTLGGQTVTGMTRLTVAQFISP